LYSYRAILTSYYEFPTIKEDPVATPDVTALQRSNLNEFLFADVGLEASGMTLSVVSVFARQGRDPWGEARRLADLPKSEAIDSLARTIAAMPRSLWDLPAAVVIAVRLTGLLPVPSTTRGMSHVTGRWPAARTAMMVVCIVLALGFAIASTMQSVHLSKFDGSDVASFTTAMPAPGDNSAK
jgi:hypothetical protein